MTASFGASVALTHYHQKEQHEEFLASLPLGLIGDYKPSLDHVLESEGGNDDDPRDPGGRTSRGIIQREWNTWRQSHPGLPADVWQAPQDQVEAIYKAKYWDALRCDELPAGVDYAVFDYGVNSGISRSAKLLQRLLGVPVDGIVGDATLAHAREVDAASLIIHICDERLAFLQALGTWGTFGRGWGRRVAEVKRDALAMAKAQPAQPAKPVQPKPAPAPVPAQATLLDRVIAGMEAKGYRIDKGPGEINIAYPEGHDRDGKRNNNKPGYWNDVRMAWTYVDGKPVLKGAWTATTQPGPYYTERPINSAGAANTFPGQYAAWKVDLHRGQYEALCQRGTLKLTRDKNRDYRREGDVVEVGDYEGINHHHGSNADDVGPHSAGCLVAKMVDGHEEFMAICKSDPRFRANRGFMFTAAILAQDDVPQSATPAPAPKPVPAPAPQPGRPTQPAAPRPWWQAAIDLLANRKG